MEGEAVAVEVDAIFMQADPDDGSAGLNEVYRQILCFGTARRIDDVLRALNTPLSSDRIGKTLPKTLTARAAPRRRPASARSGIPSATMTSEP